MSSFARSIKRNSEREEIKKKYGKKPKHSCPKCKKLTLFRKDGKKIICLQCGEDVR